MKFYSVNHLWQSVGLKFKAMRPRTNAISALLAAQLLGANAFADCHIYLNACQQTNVPVEELFRDIVDDGLNHKDPNRCMARAREYLEYCIGISSTAATQRANDTISPPSPRPAIKIADVRASTYFSVGSDWKTAVRVNIFKSQTEQFVIDGSNNWIKVNTQY